MKLTIIKIVLFLISINHLSLTYSFSEVAGDINNDNTVGLSEAVYALEVASGIKQNIEIDKPDEQWLNNSENIFYDSGKVGIGTSTPNADLSIKGNCSTKLTGYVGVLSGSKIVIGVNTLFTDELKVDDKVEIGEEKFIVDEIVNNTQLTLNKTHIKGASNVAIYTDANLLSIQDRSGNDKFIIDKSGNIGIGSDKPEGSLDLNGGNIVNVDWKNSKTGKSSGLAPDTIFCKKYKNLFGSTGGYTISFSHSDCGGVLPDNSYIGVAKVININGGMSNFIVKDAPTPGVEFWALNPNGSSGIEILYIKIE